MSAGASQRLVPRPAGNPQPQRALRGSRPAHDDPAYGCVPWYQFDAKNSDATQAKKPIDADARSELELDQAE